MAIRIIRLVMEIKELQLGSLRK